MATIADMTLDELKRLIYTLMEERRLTYWFGELDMEEVDLGLVEEPDPRSLEEILADIEQQRWTPPPGSPTPAQLIRADRDRG